MPAKRFMVSVDLETRRMSLSRLASALGIRGSPSSHSRGETRKPAGVWETTVLRLESKLDEARPLEEHLKRIFAGRAVARLRRAPLPKHCRACLNIGVLFETAMGGIEVPARVLSLLSELDMDLSVSFYPSAPDRRET